jgi:hypothetical protein
VSAGGRLGRYHFEFSRGGTNKAVNTYGVPVGANGGSWMFGYYLRITAVYGRVPPENRAREAAHFALAHPILNKRVRTRLEGQLHGVLGASDLSNVFRGLGGQE